MDFKKIREEMEKESHLRDRAFGFENTTSKLFLERIALLESGIRTIRTPEKSSLQDSSLAQASILELLKEANNFLYFKNVHVKISDIVYKRRFSSEEEIKKTDFFNPAVLLYSEYKLDKETGKPSLEVKLTNPLTKNILFSTELENKDKIIHDDEKSYESFHEENVPIKFCIDNYFFKTEIQLKPERTHKLHRYSHEKSLIHYNTLKEISDSFDGNKHVSLNLGFSVTNPNYPYAITKVDLKKLYEYNEYFVSTKFAKHLKKEDAMKLYQYTEEHMPIRKDGTLKEIGRGGKEFDSKFSTAVSLVKYMNQLNELLEGKYK
ncbi:MAG: hypothetical protein ACQESC_00685 [Nanobdellota archaeon]